MRSGGRSSGRRRWASRETLSKRDLVRVIFHNTFEDRLKQNEPLAPYTSWRVGGPAEWFLRVDDTDELIKAVHTAHRAKVPYRVIGGGSNILVSDKGVRGLVILNRARKYRLRPEGDYVAMIVDSGVSLPWLAGQLIREGVAGLEWAIGIPGTVGGAIVQNAGAWGYETADVVRAVQVMDPNGSIRTLKAEEMDFGYRHSMILDIEPYKRPVVLRALFALRRDDPEAIKQRAQRFMRLRSESQPRQASGGSTFKNPPGEYAGRLIEAAGLKGYTIGGARVSEQHANFIVTEEGVTAADIRALIEHIQQVVKEKFDVELEPEIEFVGEWD